MKRTTRHLANWFALIALAVLHPPATAHAALQAGAVVVDATPKELPVFVNGNMVSKSVDTVITPINVRAIALADDRTRLAIVVVDSCMLPRPLLDEAKSLAEKRTGIPADHIFISATHTHSAPASMGCLGTSVDPRYPGFLKQKIAGAIEQAGKNLQPARVGRAIADANEFTALRRWVRRPDKLREDPFGNLTVRANMHPGYLSEDATGPSGPEDPDLGLISFQRLDGRPIAVLANFSMHYYGDKALSADYFGVFTGMLKEEITRGAAADGGPEFVGVLGHGCSGDIYLRDYAKPAPTEKHTLQTYTAALVARAMEAYRRIQYRSDATLAMAEAKLPLNYRVPDRQRLEWAQRIVTQLGDREPKTTTEIYAREALMLHERQRTELVLQAIRIGEIGITGIPNEVYALTGLKQKAFSPLQPTFTFDLANGSEGYIPPPEQHPLGGYNTWAARTAGLEVLAEPKIVETCLQLLEQVAGKPRRNPVPTRGPAANAVLKLNPAAYWRLDEFNGPRAVDAMNRCDGIYETGVVFHLEGPQSEQFNRPGEVNRAAHFAGGRLDARVPKLGDTYSVSLWLWNGMPDNARPMSGWLFSRGRNHAFAGVGEHLGIVGQGERAGRLVFLNGDPGQTNAGTTHIDRWTWHHVVLVRTPAKTTVYLDGRPELEVETRQPGSSEVEQIFVGGRNDNADNWEGKLDEVAVFPRALTAREVGLLWQAAQPR